ncbi:hypothetical protein [Streptomyces sp. NPDC093600]|uniref:hypothetical protein n=1 Tax=Streptomyces sp. NPDC093600 TaxID=3366047 RepID=UPI0037F8B204
MALVSAVATLLAALFVCAGTTDAPAHRPSEPRMTLAFAAEEAEEYVCPYDRDDCSLFPSLSPAVLTAPPLDPPPQAEGRLPRLDAPHRTGLAPRSDALPRAPDLHVLQVLRT